MFWICAGNGVGNIEIFLANFEQCLQRIKVFYAACADPPAWRLGRHEDLGGGRARTADPNDVPDHVMSRSELRKEEGSGGHSE